VDLKHDAEKNEILDLYNLGGNPYVSNPCHLDPLYFNHYICKTNIEYFVNTVFIKLYKFKIFERKETKVCKNTL
jgi:hypothetical protein